jgi:hypothetical protein
MQQQPSLGSFHQDPFVLEKRHKKVERQTVIKSKCANGASKFCVPTAQRLLTSAFQTVRLIISALSKKEKADTSSTCQKQKPESSREHGCHRS